jgi:hypothetical protein
VTLVVIERSHTIVNAVGGITEEKIVNRVDAVTVAAVESSRGTVDAVGSTMEAKTVNRDDAVLVVIKITAIDATAD